MFISLGIPRVYVGIHKSRYTNNLAFRPVDGPGYPRGEVPAEAILGRLRASVVSLGIPRVYVGTNTEQTKKHLGPRVNPLVSRVYDDPR